MVIATDIRYVGLRPELDVFGAGRCLTQDNEQFRNQQPKTRMETTETKKQVEGSGDSLSSGVSYMMALTLAQRGMGFIRTALFCRLLAEEELGQWSLIFSFVMLGTPLTLMGITGSFGRYIEHYLQRGLVKRFLLRTGAAVAVLTFVAISLMWLNRDFVSWMLFGSVEQSNLLVPASLTLITNIAFGYFFEAVVALRRVKVGSTMDLISSWTFAILGITIVSCTGLTTYGVVLSLAAGNLLGALYALSVLSKLWHDLPEGEEEFTHLSLWLKLAPFSIGLWITNLLNNAFGMVDRYMIVHFSHIPAIEAQGLVGQYFSSMAVPLLMVGVATSLSHLVMPYLSEDWEAGRKDAVNARVNLSIKLIGMMLAIGSVFVVISGPILFGLVFGGKYDAGYQVLPYTIAFCYWGGLMTMVYNYLFCVERPRLMCVSTLIGLLANIVLNAILLPRMGLAGAGLATAAGCLLNLGISLYLATRLGFQMHRGVFCVLLFPFACGFGPFVASLCMIGLLSLANATTWFLSAQERDDLEQILQNLFAKVLPKRFQPQTRAGVN